MRGVTTQCGLVYFIAGVLGELDMQQFLTQAEKVPNSGAERLVDS